VDDPLVIGESALAWLHDCVEARFKDDGLHAGTYMLQHCEVFGEVVTLALENLFDIDEKSPYYRNRGERGHNMSPAELKQDKISTIKIASNSAFSSGKTRHIAARIEQTRTRCALSICLPKT
jgi:hypothetical protein